MGIRVLFAALMAFTLTACSLPAMNREVDAMARGFYDSVRTGTDLTNDPRLAPELRTPDVNQRLAGARSIIPNTAATRVENRSQHYNVNNGNARAELVHAYVYPDRTILAETVLLKPAGAPSWMIGGFHVRREGAAGAAQQASQPSTAQEAQPAPSQGGAKP